MFDLEIITQDTESNLSKKNENNNNLIEQITAKYRLYHINSNNLSLTNTIETFRFLPINRTNSLFLIALPEDIKPEYFIEYIGEEIEKISSIKIITEPTKNFRSMILTFFNQDMADNFYYTYKIKSIKENKTEFLYFSFLRNVIYTKNNNNNTNNFTNNINNSEEISEIPTCPLCLEKIEVSSSGIETILGIFPCERWENYKNNCAICSKLSPKVKKLLSCEKCNNNSSVWCCLICGTVGCGRYQNGHAVNHFQETRHRYSLELESQRIWDYYMDKWVHRLIFGQSKAPIDLEEEDNVKNLSEQEFYEKMENIISEYNKVLSTQLGVQRKYYMNEMKILEEGYEEKNKVVKNKYNEVKDKIEEKKKKINGNNKFIKDCYKKINQIEKKTKEIKDKIEFNKICIKDLQEDNKDQKGVELTEMQKKKMAILEQKLAKKKELELELQKKYQDLQ